MKPNFNALKRVEYQLLRKCREKQSFLMHHSYLDMLACLSICFVLSTPSIK